MGSAFINKASTANSSGDRAETSDRAIRWIGDLDHPFYNDERSRFVWYEASAVGFQLLFVGVYFLAGLMFWIGGASSLPYGMPLLLLAIVSSVVVTAVVRKNSAEYFPNRLDFSRSRGRLALFVGVFTLAGAIRALLDLGGDGGFVGGLGEGAAAGAVVGAIVGVGALAFQGRQHRREEELAAQRED